MAEARGAVHLPSGYLRRGRPDGSARISSSGVGPLPGASSSSAPRAAGGLGRTASGRRRGSDATSESAASDEEGMGLGGLFGDDDDEGGGAFEETDPVKKAEDNARRAAIAARRAERGEIRSAVLRAGLVTDSFGFAFAATPVTGLWTQELNALTAGSASLAWACWLLDFLLNQVATVLSRGAVHNQQLYDALTTFLRTPSVEPGIRGRVIELLTLLLIHPHMWTALPDLSALEGVEEAVLRRAEADMDAAGSKGGFSFLQPRLQGLLELVLARHAAQKALETAAVAGGDAAGKGKSKAGAAGGAGASAGASGAEAVRSFPGSEPVGVLFTSPFVMSKAQCLAAVEGAYGTVPVKGRRAFLKSSPGLRCPCRVRRQ